MTLWGRFARGSGNFYGRVEDDRVHPLDSPKRRFFLRDLKILPPVVPSKIIAVGLNFADHAAETGSKLPPSPLTWLKSPGSILPPRGKIHIAFPEHRTDHEVELAIVIGKHAKNVSVRAAARAILGYTTAQDISDRTIQRGEGQWFRAKSFDTYTPLGPWIDTEFRPLAQAISLFCNGERRQYSTLDQMIFKPHQLVSFISQSLTLDPGDLILTGTPPGVSPIRAGDHLEARIEGLAPLINSVV
ncbi:fumarylacetoacetate hydrolase family protein [bacterium]|nr:fumarylacetoacetate hydrolase family protein [bacterium]